MLIYEIIQLEIGIKIRGRKFYEQENWSNWIIFLPLFISSCGNDEYVEAGFSERSNHDFRPGINLALKAKKKQKINEVYFDLYPGIRKGFEKEWEEYPCNPHSGNFCMVLRISESGKTDEMFFKIDNFPNEDKYLVTYYNDLPGKISYIPQFTEYIEYKIDFSKYSEKNNIYVSWHVTYCDEPGADIYMEVLNGLCGSEGQELYVNCDTDTAFLRSAYE